MLQSLQLVADDSGLPAQLAVHLPEEPRASVRALREAGRADSAAIVQLEVTLGLEQLGDCGPETAELPSPRVPPGVSGSSTKVTPN